MKKAVIAVGFVATVLLMNGCDDTTSANGNIENTSKVDTLVVNTVDTVVVNKIDTLVVDKKDTVVVEKKDTVEVNKIDTLVVSKKDTVVVEKKDTVVVNKIDTLFVNNSNGFVKDYRDGQVYKTVQIGNQVWMAENLNYRYLQRTAELDSSSLLYEADGIDPLKIGRLYTWSAAMDSARVFSKDGSKCGDGVTCFSGDTVRGVCMEGWHLPSEAEWKVLLDNVGIDSVAYKLMSEDEWYYSHNYDTDEIIIYKGEDTYGFNVLPYLKIWGPDVLWRSFFGFEANYATSTEKNEDDVMIVRFLGYDMEVNVETMGKGSGSTFMTPLHYSVRCVKNAGL